MKTKNKEREEEFNEEIHNNYWKNGVELKDVTTLDIPLKDLYKYTDVIKYKYPRKKHEQKELLTIKIKKLPEFISIVSSGELPTNNTFRELTNIFINHSDKLPALLFNKLKSRLISLVKYKIIVSDSANVKNEFNQLLTFFEGE